MSLFDFVGSLITEGLGGWWASRRETKIRNSKIEGLECRSEPANGGVFSVRVFNGSDYAIHACWGYVSLDYDQQDVFDVLPPPSPPGPTVHFTQQNYRPLTEEFPDRLHWAVGAMPPMADICSKEPQVLRVGRIDIRRGWVGLFTEDGLMPGQGGRQGAVEFRVRLRKREKPYSGVLKIVSLDIPAKRFALSIDSNNSAEPISVMGNL